METTAFVSEWPSPDSPFVYWFVYWFVFGGVLVVLMVVFAMLLVLVTAGAVVAYVAFPHRGEEIPGAPWLGEAMGKARRALPDLDESEQDLLHR
jgi:hypothetical protein